MNGPAIAGRVRKRHPAVKVLYTTGHPAGLGGGRARLPHDAPVVAKPYTRQALTRELSALFAQGAAAA
jgi:hypothetical protein